MPDTTPLSGSTAENKQTQANEWLNSQGASCPVTESENKDTPKHKGVVKHKATGRTGHPGRDTPVREAHEGKT